MSAAVAARYCGYKTTAGLRKAHHDRKVFPVGRRGGGGSWTWARTDLDRFLRGGSPASDPAVSTRNPAEPLPQSESERRPAERERRATVKRRPSPATEAALQRIRGESRRRETIPQVAVGVLHEGHGGVGRTGCPHQIPTAFGAANSSRAASRGRPMARGEHGASAK